MPIEIEDGGAGLLMSARCDSFLRDKVTQKRLDLGDAKAGRMLFAMEMDVSAHPVSVDIGRPRRAPLEEKTRTQPVQEARRLRGWRYGWHSWRGLTSGVSGERSESTARRG